MRSLKKKKMSPVRTVYVPCFSPQPGFSQRDLTDLIMEQKTEASCQDKRAKVRGVKTRSVLKVKLPTVNKKETKEDKTRRKRTPEPPSKKTKTTVNRGGGRRRGEQSVGTDTVVVDAFYFPGRPINEKEKAKLAVLRTISKVLEENQLIRQRLSVLSQVS